MQVLQHWQVISQYLNQLTGVAGYKDRMLVIKDSIVFTKFGNGYFIYVSQTGEGGKDPCHSRLDYIEKF